MLYNVIIMHCDMVLTRFKSICKGSIAVVYIWRPISYLQVKCLNQAHQLLVVKMVIKDGTHLLTETIGELVNLSSKIS